MPNDNPATPTDQTAVGTTITVTGPKPQVDAIVDLLEREYELGQETQYAKHPDPAAHKLGVVAAGVFLKPFATIVAPGSQN